MNRPELCEVVLCQRHRTLVLRSPLTLLLEVRFQSKLRVRPSNAGIQFSTLCPANECSSTSDRIDLMRCCSSIALLECSDFRCGATGPSIEFSPYSKETLRYTIIF